MILIDPETVMTRTIEAVGRRLGEWDRRARMRRALARISPRLLVDVGLSPEAVARESRQPFWRPLAGDLDALGGAAPAAVTPGPALPAAVRPAATLPAAVRPAATLAAAIFPCRA